MLLCLDTSRILNTEAPRRAAEVRKPERRLWAPIVVASSPIMPAYYFTSAQTLLGRQPRVANPVPLSNGAEDGTGFDSGDGEPLHHRVDRAARPAPDDGDRHALPLLIGLRSANRHSQTVVRELQIVNVEGDAQISNLRSDRPKSYVALTALEAKVHVST